MCNLNNDMNNIFNSFKDELTAISVNQLKPDVFKNTKINGTSIFQYASLTNTEIKTVLIEVWEKRYVSEIQSEIQKKFNDLNFRTDGNKIYISSPILSQEYRTDTIKRIKGIGEQTKIKFRTLKQKYNKNAEKLNNPTSAKNKNQDILDDFCSRVDKLVRDKIDLIKKV